uniref:Hyaluronidase n=1 Tax=Parastrongyloides trichosuri TaxID=131310 RepID=A0A0N4ZMQ7_PARTI
MKIIIVIISITFVIFSSSFQFIPSKIYWNIPSNICLQKGINISLENYGIISNNEQMFHGDKIVTLYEKDVGLYPYLIKINNSFNEFVNGGIPQNVDINKHLKKLQENINLIIPNKSFDGLAIIDIEKWRPYYEANWLSKDIYRVESKNLIIQRNQNDTKINLFKLAEEEFDNAAYNFLTKTLKKCKLLRPFAKWGFYGLPICDMNGDKRKGLFCYHTINDRMLDFLKYTDALFPTAYIYGGHSYKTQKRYITKVLEETKRLNKLLKNYGYEEKDIYVFHKIETYNINLKTSHFYDPYQLCISQEESIKNKCNGIIIWSTSNNISSRCHSYKKYMELELGPHIRKFDEAYKLCENNPEDVFCHKNKNNNSICNELLTLKNIKKWCYTEFYGKECFSLKVNSTSFVP